MMNMKNWGRRALTVMLAGTLAATVAAPTAFAATADAYKPTEYRVTVYAGNQGKVSLGDADQAAESVQLDPAVGLNGVADFSDIEYTVENEKYYAKGIRVAGLDNVRSDKNTDTVDAEGNPVNTAGVDTMLYAVPTPDGGLGNTSVPITEDTDFVVAYGILANRVAYTVNYVDADGNPLMDSQTFFGDIGDRPATTPVYIENYLPQASVVLLTLSEDEAKNVITFRYTRLAEGATTEQQPSGRVDVITSDGSRATGVYTTAITEQEAVAAANQAATRAAAADPANPIEATPLTTDAGTQVIAEDGTPLDAPDVETINDDENALASGQQPGDSTPVANTAWIPWAVAAVVLACLIAFILLRARKEQQGEEAQQA